MINEHGIEGLTLRDYFAASALQGLLASGHFTKPCDDPVNRVFYAYQPDDLDKTDAYEDRPSATSLMMSLKCRKSYNEDAITGSFTYDCVEKSYYIADAMMRARKEDA